MIFWLKLCSWPKYWSCVNKWFRKSWEPFPTGKLTSALSLNFSLFIVYKNLVVLHLNPCVLINKSSHFLQAGLNFGVLGFVLDEEFGLRNNRRYKELLKFLLIWFMLTTLEKRKQTTNVTCVCKNQKYLVKNSNSN